MKVYVQTVNKKPFEIDKVNFDPQTEEEEILQNVKTICNTPKNSVPMDRDFGVNTDFLDKPTPVAMAMIQNEIIEAVRKYEPRAYLESIHFDDDWNDGEGPASLRITIRIKHAEE